MPLTYHNTAKTPNLQIIFYTQFTQIFPLLQASESSEPQNKNVLKIASSDKPMKGQKEQWFHQHGKTWSRHPFQHS